MTGVRAVYFNVNINNNSGKPKMDQCTSQNLALITVLETHTNFANYAIGIKVIASLNSAHLDLFSTSCLLS